MASSWSDIVANKRPNNEIAIATTKNNTSSNKLSVGEDKDDSWQVQPGRKKFSELSKEETAELRRQRNRRKKEVKQMRREEELRRQQAEANTSKTMSFISKDKLDQILHGEELNQRSNTIVLATSNEDAFPALTAKPSKGPVLRSEQSEPQEESQSKNEDQIECLGTETSDSKKSGRRGKPTTKISIMDAIVEKRSKVSKMDRLRLAKARMKNMHVRKGGNILDSTAPIGVKKGKVKTRKKLSTLKKIVIRDRLSRKEKMSQSTKQNDQEDKSNEEQADANDNEVMGKVAKLKITAKNESSSTEDNSEKSLYLRLEAEAKRRIHSRKFQEYCDQLVTPELVSHVRTLLSDLIRFQDYKHFTDPMKAKASRRYVLGLNETRKYLQVSKVEMVILATNVEPVRDDNGLFHRISEIKRMAKNTNAVVVFAMDRFSLGRTCKRKGTVTCAAILNHQGSETSFKAIKFLVSDLRQRYMRRLSETVNELRKTTGDSSLSLESSEQNVNRDFCDKLKQLVVTTT